MIWHKYLGIDSDLLKKVDPKQNERQTFIMSSLAIMLFVLSIIVFISSTVYTLIIFHNVIISILAGLFLSVVIFNLYRLLVITALDVSETTLEKYYADHYIHYDDYVSRNQDFTDITDENIDAIVNKAKDDLREKTSINFESNYKKNLFLTHGIRVFILSIIALVFANGIELFLFNNEINIVLNDLLDFYVTKNDTWYINNILKPALGDNFYIIDSNSLLLALEILNFGLGNWKILLDFLFIILFILPLAIVLKSNEVKRSEYIRELALSELTITFKHFLLTQRFCKNILYKIRSTNIDYINNSKAYLSGK
jgi:hypothetical protein